MEQRKALVVPVSLLCQDPWWAGVGRVCSGHRLSFWVLPQMPTVHGGGRGLLSQGGMCWAQANCSSSTSGSIPFSARALPWEGPEDPQQSPLPGRAPVLGQSCVPGNTSTGS